MEKMINSNTFFEIIFEKIFNALIKCVEEIGYADGVNYEIGNGYSVAISTKGRLMKWEFILFKDNEKVRTYPMEHYFYWYEAKGGNMLRVITNEIIEYIEYAENNK